MKKKPSLFAYRCQYLAARIFACLLCLLPLSLAVMVGKTIALLVHALDRRHRQVCIDAMQKCLQLDAEAAAALTRKTYLHFGIFLAEFPRLPRFNRDNLDQYVDWGGHDKTYEKLLADGKGVIFLSGHLGNWEASGSAMGVRGYTVGAVARPLDNPLIDNWVRSIREAQGQEIWDKFGALRAATRTLKEGKGFGILMDQDGGRNGIFTTFFGRECSTWPTVADLAMRSGAAIIAMAMHRQSPMRFVLEVGEPFYAEGNPEDKEAERRRLTQRCNDELEKLIRKQPEQWLWLHRRWKTQAKK
ncbi:MAG: lysophospholipid acyltransferase family protein [Planctomycetes bacterium]|nr:lysophospholipid acyltransferase family protein [Planctomycetota bacterium]